MSSQSNLQTKNQWINYHHLYYFKTIAELGSVSKAAVELRLGQPTLSAQLKQFEDVIGIQLFDRQHRKLILTEQGKVALEYAKQIFEMGGEMIEVLNDRIKPTKISLKIGALDSVPKHVLVKLVNQVIKNPNCQISLLEGNTDELIRLLNAHQIDLMITNFLPLGTDAGGIYSKQLSKKNISFYAAKKFKNLKKGFPQSISEIPLVFPTHDSKLRHDLDHWAKLNNIETNIVVESQDIAVKKLLALEGVGLFPTSSHAVKGLLQSNRLVELGEVQGVSEELYLLSVKRKIPHPIAHTLMQNFRI